MRRLADGSVSNAQLLWMIAIVLAGIELVQLCVLLFGKAS